MMLVLGWVAVMAAGGTWWVRRDVATYARFEAPWRSPLWLEGRSRRHGCRCIADILLPPPRIVTAGHGRA